MSDVNSKLGRYLLNGPSLAQHRHRSLLTRAAKQEGITEGCTLDDLIRPLVTPWEPDANGEVRTALDQQLRYRQAPIVELRPISGAGGIADGAAERYKSLPTLIMHGAKDSIVPPATSRRAVAALQAVGAPHIYLEFPDKDHEFWIRRGAAHMEKVFVFFSLVSKQTTVLPQK